jgi:glycosyltransferase involved in cell wall biosynthesis
VAPDEKIFLIMMEERPLVSVVCVSWNHAAYIERSFRSVADQTLRDIEVLYVDNNSTDNSFEIGDAVFKQSGLPYKGFKQTTNRGLGANLNFLIQQSKGKYISVLSGDDFFDPKNLEEKVNFFEQHPEYGMVYGAGFYYYYSTGKTELLQNPKWKSGWLFKEILSGNFINAIGALISRKVLDDVGLFDEASLIEDWDMWIRISEKYPIGFIDKALVYYGKQTGSNLSANMDYMDRGAAYIFNKYAHHREINTAKKKYRLFRVYQYASAKPSMKNLGFILKNFQFNTVYFKQVFKFMGRLFRS